MNWRALGCGVLAAAVFVGLGIVALNLSLSRVGCPDELRDGPVLYRAEGAAVASPRVPAASPGVAGVAASPVAIGITHIGIEGRRVYVAPGDEPVEGSTERPSALALDCGDGTFQGYLLEDR